MHFPGAGCLACLAHAAALTLAALQHEHPGGFATRVEQGQIVALSPAAVGAIVIVCPSQHESQPMNGLLSSYLPIVIFIGVALVVGLALMAAPFLIAYKNARSGKAVGL